MTTGNKPQIEDKFAAAEEYGNAMRNWDRVHSAWLRNDESVTLEDDVAAWNRRISAFKDLKRIEVELESERPESPEA